MIEPYEWTPGARCGGCGNEIPEGDEIAYWEVELPICVTCANAAEPEEDPDGLNAA